VEDASKGWLDWDFAVSATAVAASVSVPALGVWLLLEGNEKSWLSGAACTGVCADAAPVLTVEAVSFPLYAEPSIAVADCSEVPLCMAAPSGRCELLLARELAASLAGAESCSVDLLNAPSVAEPLCAASATCGASLSSIEVETDDILPLQPDSPV
jgi:hypothetical protein